MIDDDLRNLLGELDESDEVNVKKQLHTKKNTDSDESIKDLDKRFEAQHLETTNLSDDDITKAIEIFKNGYADAISQHYSFTSQFNKSINDLSLPENVINSVGRYKYTFDKYIENIEKTCNIFITTHNYDTLLRNAKKNFYLYFPQSTETDNRLQFIILIELFLHIRDYNRIFRKEWRELEKSIGVINFISDAEAHSLAVKCSSIINDAFWFCKRTDIFLQYIANILSLPYEQYDITEKNIAKYVKFNENIRYEYEHIFDFKLHKEDAESSPITVAEAPAEVVDSEHGSGLAEADLIQDASLEEVSSPKSSQQSAVEFTVKGSRTWNTREPYVLHLDSSKLQKNYNDLNQTFYFNEATPDATTIDGAIKRAMLRYLRSNRFPVIHQYEEFIYKLIIQQVQEIATIFQLKDDSLHLFIYHLGPKTMEKIILSHINLTRIAVCYKLISEKNISKHIPDEFIKEKILLWFESNINSFDLPFDGVAEYNALKDMISKKLKEKRNDIDQKIEQAAKHYYDKTGKQVDKKLLFKHKEKELLGTLFFIIYKRFFPF